MAVYYVRPDGNDTHTGLGYTSGLAWLTITKAKNTVAAGDTVYIAPGTYREVVTLVTAGTAGNVISYIGDSSCSKFLDINQGYVRITGCDVTETPLSTLAIINCNAKEYQLFKNLVIDGSANGTVGGYDGVSIGAYTTITLENCIISGSYMGVNGGSTSVRPILKNCLVSGGYYAAYRVEAYSCLIVGGKYGTERSVLYNCVIRGGEAANYLIINAVNCIVFGQYGFSSTAGALGGTITNCVAFGCEFAFAGQQQYLDITNCLAVNCRYGGYGSSSGSPLDVSSVKAVSCSNASRGTTAETGTAVNAKYCGFVNLYKIWNFADSIKFDLFNESNWSDNSVSWTGDTVDIINKIRRLGDGTIDVGAISYQNQTPEFSDVKTNSPAFKILRKGETIININVKKNISRTAKVWVKFSVGAGSLKPSLVADSYDGCISINTSTAVGSGVAYEELSVSFTPTYDGTVQIKMRANEVDSGASTIFSDLLI